MKTPSTDEDLLKALEKARSDFGLRVFCHIGHSSLKTVRCGWKFLKKASNWALIFIFSWNFCFQFHSSKVHFLAFLQSFQLHLKAFVNWRSLVYFQGHEGAFMSSSWNFGAQIIMLTGLKFLITPTDTQCLKVGENRGKTLVWSLKVKVCKIVVIYTIHVMIFKGSSHQKHVSLPL